MAATPESDWYLREWLEFQGKKISELVNELDMHKTTAYRLWRGEQPYRKDFVNLIAAWLEIEAYELLMPPQEAMRVRRVREAVYQLAAEPPAREWKGPPSARPPKKTADAA